MTGHSLGGSEFFRRRNFSGECCIRLQVINKVSIGNKRRFILEIRNYGSSDDMDIDFLSADGYGKAFHGLAAFI